MVLDATLFNTQHYKVWIKGKLEQSREWSGVFPYNGKGVFRSPLTYFFMIKAKALKLNNLVLT